MFALRAQKMAYFMSFIKGVAALIFAGFVLYYGLGYLDRCSGFKGFLASLVLFPLVLYSAAYIAEKLTLGKLGSFGHTVVMVLVLMCFGAIYMTKHEKREIASLQTAARALGLNYHSEFKLNPALAKNPALQRGFMPMVKDVLAGSYRDIETIIFKYEYEKLSSDYPDHYFRTAVVFFDPQVKLPEFYLKPQSLGGRIFKKKDIDFEEDPKFSKRYYLTGKDPKAIRNVFAVQQRQALVESKNKWAIGSAEGYVVIYADDKMDEQIKPNAKEIGAYLEQTWLLYDVLSSPVRMSH